MEISSIPKNKEKTVPFSPRKNTEVKAYLFWHICLFSKGNETPSSERKAHLNKYTSSGENQSPQDRGFKATT